jgi:hypothetical protein
LAQLVVTGPLGKFDLRDQHSELLPHIQIVVKSPAALNLLNYITGKPFLVRIKDIADCAVRGVLDDPDKVVLLVQDPVDSVMGRRLE